TTVEIVSASRRLRSLPGRPSRGTITGGTDQGTEAIHAGLVFEHGKVKAFKLDVDTLKVTFGSYLTITAQNFKLDTGAGPNDPLVSFTSVGAEVTVGSLTITGEARNCAFLDDGSFQTRPGFGVFLSVGSASGDSFMWPSWLPVHVNAIGIEWPDIQADAGNF